MFIRDNAIKEAFEKVKDDILALASEIQEIKTELYNLRCFARHLDEQINELKLKKAHEFEKTKALPQPPPDLQELLKSYNFKLPYDFPDNKNYFYKMSEK